MTNQVVLRDDDNAIPLRVEFPGWLSGSLANSVAKALLETKFVNPKTAQPMYSVHAVHTSSSGRTVGRVAHANDVPEEEYSDFVLEVW